MPGIIKVSVLNFYHSASRNSVKVSLGSREFEAFDEAEFSFPLINLRDKIIIFLQDNEGNTLSSEEVETRLVIQKNVWENTLVVNGKGYARLKFEFLLSNEDRERIRLTRNMASKKKHDELLNKSNHVELSGILTVPQMEEFLQARESGKEDGLPKKPEIVTVSKFHELYKVEEKLQDEDYDAKSSEFNERGGDMIAYDNREATFCEEEWLFSNGWMFIDKGMGVCFTVTMNKALMKYIKDCEFCVDREVGMEKGNCVIKELNRIKDSKFEVPQPFRKAVEVAIMVGFAVLIVFT